jgi:uncharacterized phiE125 gp8 family phage protein
MTTEIMTPPTELAISIASAKRMLRIDGDYSDAEIEAWIRGITDAAAGIMRRSIMPTTYLLRLDRFPDSIRLDFPKVQSVTSVQYIDTDGAWQTLDPADYEVESNLDGPGYIVPAPNTSWPDTYERINAVKVIYVAAWGTIPPKVLLYLMAELAQQYDPAVRPEMKTIQSNFVGGLLDLEKVYG